MSHKKRPPSDSFGREDRHFETTEGEDDFQEEFQMILKGERRHPPKLGDCSGGAMTKREGSSPEERT